MIDQEIVTKILNGDKDAYGDLVSRYEQKIERYIKKFIWNIDDTRDVLQNIFIKAYTYLNSYDKDLSFSSWLYRIAHNESINFLKKHKRLGFSFGDIVEIDTILPTLSAKEKADDNAIYRENKELLDKHLEKLDIKYREIIVLYFYEDLSYEEIADILQIPSSTVGVRLNRAKAKLKEFLKNDESAKNILEYNI